MLEKLSKVQNSKDSSDYLKILPGKRVSTYFIPDFFSCDP